MLNNDEMKKMLIRASVFTIGCMAVMFQRSATKHILITDAAGGNINREYSDESFNLLVDRNVSKNQAGKLIIPLPSGVSSDDIVLEDNYIDHELLIYVDGREEGFYLDNPVITDLDIFEGATCIQENSSGNVCLDFKLDGLYANESSLTESSTIEVRFYKPYDEYDKIVVIDPCCGGAEIGDEYDGLSEKDVALDIALLIKEASDKAEDNSIKFYYTRLSDTTVEADRRLEFIEETGADLLVEVGAGVYEDGLDGVRSYYNDEYYRRDLCNADFASLIHYNCAGKTSGKELIIYPCDQEEAVLMASTIPTVKVSAGALNGNSDRIKLQDKSYKKKIASGIYQGIAEAFEVIK